MAKLGLQQNEVAERIGVAPAAVNNWLSGGNAAKGRNLRLLSDVLACDPHWLSGEDTPPEGLREDYPQAEIRDRCHRFIDQVLSRRPGDRNWMSWVLVELERHFPLPAAPSAAPPENPAYRPLNSVSAAEAEASVAAAERALELEGRGSRPSGGAGETSANKSAPSPGTSPESKGKPSPPGRAPK